MSGRRFLFEEHDTFVVGREPGCHIELPNDPAVSRHHFLLEVHPPCACLRDLGSLNGTFVNGQRVAGERSDCDGSGLTQNAGVFLADGDTIRVGETEIQVRLLAVCSRCGASVSGAAVPPGHIETTVELTCRDCLAQDAARPAATQTADEGMPERPEASADTITGTRAVNSLTRQYKARLSALAERAPPELDGFTVKSRLGRGACGEVYLAKRLCDGLKVAIKTMVPQARVGAAVKQRFLQEARYLGEFQHRNIVRILDSSATEDEFLFVMEFCDGGSVRQLVEKSGGRTPVSEAVDIMLQALAGLAFVHQHGVVHRDFKPDNLLLTNAGGTRCAKVADLGLAKSFERAGLSGMTVTGTCCGTFPFMPREQLTNFKYVKPTTDVWSAGATLYYMLTGECPRTMAKGEDPMMVVLSRHAVPVRERNGDIPEDLAAVVDRSLVTDPAERFADASAMRQALLSMGW